MIKLILNLATIIVTIFVSLLFGSCNFNMDLGGKTIKGSGKIVTETRNLKDFDKVTVARGLECEIIQSDKTEVVVVADDNLVKGIKTTVENGTLKITSIYNNYHNVSSKKIMVYLPVIVSLETTSGAELKSRNVIKSNDILIKSSSGSEMEVDVESEKITAESTSGSDLILKGKAIILETSSSSGSLLDAERLLANEIISQSTSGSETTVNPILKLSAKASSGSSIGYVKKPNQIDIEESSGGSVGKE
jgi:Putative auto-transporter adhesin, head GIN domain